MLYFATDKALLGKDLPGMAAALKPGGRLWIAYPSPFPAGISGESDCVR